MLEQTIAEQASFEQTGTQALVGEMEGSRVPSCRPTDDPDAALVDALRAQSPMAFDSLVKGYQRRLLNVALRITRNREDAEDVVQESFLKVFTRLESFRGDSQFASWLTRITINQALMAVRGLARKPISLDRGVENDDSVVNRKFKACEPTPEQLCAQSEFERLVSHRSAGMKRLSRWVFELRVEKDLSEVEAARVTGLTVSAVKSRLCRARRELRKRMHEYRRPAKMPQIKEMQSALRPGTNEREHSQCQSGLWLPGTLCASDPSTSAIV